MIKQCQPFYQYVPPKTSEDQSIVVSSMDSGLEAFSHNPTDGSLTALAVQPTVNTNYLNQVGGQAVLGRQDASPTPWLTERHGYDPTCLNNGRIK